jgi:hypothetical protein
MNLPNPVSIQPPSITKSNGEILTFHSKTLNQLDITLIDNSKRKTCFARLRMFPRLLELWSGKDYEDIGDYTQAQAEARILELLGDDIKIGLEKLFNKF